MYKTPQEDFWAGSFGNDYIDRNKEAKIISSNIALFSRILSRTLNVKSVIEFGSNIGLNLIAIKRLIPESELSAIEINEKACAALRDMKFAKVYAQSILNFKPDYQRDLVFTKGVLIHINPDSLPDVYRIIYETSSKYICLAEYYNPSPVEVKYREHDGRLFKRDFAGELLDKYKDLVLIDYGFVYHRDYQFSLDDITWFLLEKV